MKRIKNRPTLRGAKMLGLALFFGGSGTAGAQTAEVSYPRMAPIEQYRQADEVALARSAAPPSISNDAEIMTLGSHGYETAVKGKNGFVCIVERSWSSDVDDAEFWNPKIRAPFCYNPASARSVLPTYLKRTEWLLAGASKADILARTQAELAANEITAPEVGAMCYMMSKHGYLGDAAGGHWRPHIMFFLPRSIAPAAWGANLPGAPMKSNDGGLEPLNIFFAAVPNWSDGTPGPMTM